MIIAILGVLCILLTWIYSLSHSKNEARQASSEES